MKTDISPDMETGSAAGDTGGAPTRRSFLKTTGAALAAGLVPAAAFPGSGPQSGATADGCGFSALPSGFVYLNSGTEGSMPDCVLGNYRKGLAEWAADPTTSYETDPVMGKHQHVNREQAARFFGVEKDNICLTDNTTMGLNMTLMGLNFSPGDKVIVTNHEHPAIRSPLTVLSDRLNLEVITRVFPPADALREMDADALIDALFPVTPALRGAKALAVSHVYPTTGVRLPLAALRAHADELGVGYLIVDGAQALGAVDLTPAGDSLQHCDFYACPGHKWLNGPPSTGVLYIRNAAIRPPEFYPTLSQRMGKYAGCGDGGACFPMAEALQVRGNSNAPGFRAMVRAMQFAMEQGGPGKIEQHVLGLSREVKSIVLGRAPHALVSPHGDPALHSGLTAFFPFDWQRPEKTFSDHETADRVVAKLLEKNIQVRSIGFANGADGPEDTWVIRVSTGYFNTSAQIERLGQALQDVLTGLG